MATAVAASTFVALELNGIFSDKDGNKKQLKTYSEKFPRNTNEPLTMMSKNFFTTRNKNTAFCLSVDSQIVQPDDGKLYLNTTKSRGSYQEIDDENERFEKCLTYHRQLLQEYKEKWDYVSNRSSRVPTTQWPAYPDTLPFPHTMQLSTLIPELTYCRHSPNDQNDQTTYCQSIQFQIAYILLSQQQSMQPTESTSIEQDQATASVRYGWSLLKELAESGHADAMCLYAQTLNNGNVLIPLEPNPARAVAWMHHCNSLHPDHAPTLYELGVAYYTGEGTTEDEDKAVQIYFHRAANLNHAGAAYMLGDSILDGVGCKDGKRDRALALDWLIKSGDLGHRGARSRVLAVLEYDESKDYGEFTDASRQSLKNIESKQENKHCHIENTFNEDLQVDVEGGVEEKEESEEEKEARHWAEVRKKVHLHERKFTLAGPSNLQVLKKRRTVVLKSRDSSGKS